uniref:Uncharacterized protein n=1 Tax=Phocoena sinus TaxID=42100 RepID=A0A8C9AYY8_PHOSS
MADTYFLTQGLSVLVGSLLLPFGSLAGSQIKDEAKQFFRSDHKNNWAVLACTSQFWFNYQHVTNILYVYRTIKRLGVPDRTRKRRWKHLGWKTEDLNGGQDKMVE